MIDLTNKGNKTNVVSDEVVIPKSNGQNVGIESSDDPKAKDLNLNPKQKDSFVHFEIVDDRPYLCDGDVYDFDLMKKSLVEVLKQANFKDSKDKQAFILKICSMFRLPTDFIQLSNEDAVVDIIADAADNEVSVQKQNLTSFVRQNVPIHKNNNPMDEAEMDSGEEY